jgi:two-component system chemotaxis response regulator CheY
MADIDHFKYVNDEYGHAAGDRVLAHFGALLRTHTRPTDIVTRFGGEEFIVLMPHTRLAQASAKAEQIRNALAAEQIAPLVRPVTSSFGVAELLHDEEGSSFLKRVDAALYRAKKDGRNRVVESPVPFSGL